MDIKTIFALNTLLFVYIIKLSRSPSLYPMTLNRTGGQGKFGLKLENKNNQRRTSRVTNIQEAVKGEGHDYFLLFL